MSKSPDAFRTISEVADWLGVPAHVLRFWESKFTQVKPVKRAGGRRYYRPADMQLLGGIKSLLHNDGMTIKGVQKMLREQGIPTVSSFSQPLDADLGEAPAVEARVLPFKARPMPASAPDLPEEDAEEEVAPVAGQPPLFDGGAAPDVGDDEELEPEAEPLPDPVAAAPEPAPKADAKPQPESPRLPSFLHRKLDEPDARPARPRARVVDAPDPAPEAEIEATPGTLSGLGRLDGLSQAQLRALVPVAQSLRAWLDRTTGARAS